jgi:hypothetical protein
MKIPSEPCPSDPQRSSLCVLRELCGFVVKNSQLFVKSKSSRMPPQRHKEHKAPPKDDDDTRISGPKDIILGSR